MPKKVSASTRDQLHEVGARHQRLRAELDDVREELAALIVAATEEGVPQVVIVKASGYTREAVRRIVDPSKRDRANEARKVATRVARTD